MSNMEKLCKECKYYDWPVSCYVHNKKRIDLVDGSLSFKSDNCRDMRSSNHWTYFWFWNNCNKSGRLWERRDNE